MEFIKRERILVGKCWPQPTNNDGEYKPTMWDFQPMQDFRTCKAGDSNIVGSGNMLTVTSNTSQQYFTVLDRTDTFKDLVSGLKSDDIYTNPFVVDKGLSFKVKEYGYFLPNGFTVINPPTTWIGTQSVDSHVATVYPWIMFKPQMQNIMLPFDEFVDGNKIVTDDSGSMLVAQIDEGFRIFNESNVDSYWFGKIIRIRAYLKIEIQVSL